MWADVVVYDPRERWTVSPDNIRYKCGWSPLEGWELQGRVRETIVSGQLAYSGGRVDDSVRGRRVEFAR
jgi:dihydroorotase